MGAIGPKWAPLALLVLIRHFWLSLFSPKWTPSAPNGRHRPQMGTIGPKWAPLALLVLIRHFWLFSVPVFYPFINWENDLFIFLLTARVRRDPLKRGQINGGQK